MLSPNHFSPHETLAAALLSLLPKHDDGAHDLAHLLRVWRVVETISDVEGGDREILLAATLLHDAVHVEKNSPDRARASQLAADYARTELRKLGWSADRVERVSHAVEAHSYSAGITPETLEARILQDADRLDAIGAVGIARCFYTAGRMASQLYDAADPAGKNRPLDDRRFALDHFEKKLFRVAANMTTGKGREIAAERGLAMRAFVDGFLSEAGA